MDEGPGATDTGRRTVGIAPLCDTDVRRTGPELYPVLSVGFNPFRGARRTSADYLMVVVALTVCALLVIWALFG